jgi:hypothetical protein
MGNEFESTSIRSRRRRRPRTSEPSSLLTDLEERFAQFRREHARGVRVPDDLRSAALVAHVKGVSAGAIQRTCGVSWSQLMAWKGARRSARAERVSRGAKSTPEVRIFSVVDEPVDRGTPAVSTNNNELELRLGPWTVSVRLTDRLRTERG